MNESITYGPMKESDVIQMNEGFLDQGWSDRLNVLKGYYAEQQAGKRFVVFARVNDMAAGYATLLPCNPNGPELLRKYPVVNDFNVLEKYQRQGIGMGILDRIEAEAAKTSACIALAVGMHSGYGAAQRIYVRRGYIPDGSGIWYQDRLLPMNAPCYNDDELNLYFSKELTK